jgi:hypothetical protein
MPSTGGYSAFVVDGDFDHDGREDVVIQAEQGSWPSYQNQLKAFSPWFEPIELTACVQKPCGGETFRSGSVRNIHWLSAVPPLSGDSSVEIQISLNGGSGPWDTIVSDTPNDGCYQWVVDAGGSPTCRVKVIVNTSVSSVSALSASDFTIIGNSNPPYAPEIDGEIRGTAGEEYEYTFFTMDPEEENISYYVDWDDGTSNGWTDFVPSGTEIVLAHTWEEQGDYIIKAKAKDIHNSVSDWGELEVEMPLSFEFVIRYYFLRG